jgi:hypothetical protein
MTESDDRNEDEREVNDMEPTHADPAAWRDDEVLLAALREALATAQHPRDDQLIADAQDAFSFSTITDEVAALVFDSLWEDKLETASRAVASVRTLVFESAELSLEIEVSSEGIVGQVTPGGLTTVEAERPNGRRAVIDTDEFGSFTLASPGSGPLRFHLRGSGARAVTDWVNAAA